MADPNNPAIPQRPTVPHDPTTASNTTASHGSVPLHDLSALALRDGLAAGTFSAREITAHFLDRIRDANPRLGAFVTVTAGAAMRAAEAADERHAGGASLGILHGLPLAFKDLTDVAGAPTTHGSAAVEHRIAAADSPLPAVLRRAGAISLGKTQVPEFGLTSYSENQVAAPARNPHDHRLSPGGSSGGSAAAVAARLLPFAPGTDGGGSVRIPAAATGLVGLKPNRGRVASGSGQGDVSELVVAGPLARTAADAGLLLDAMCAETNFRSLSAASLSAASLSAASLSMAPGRGRPGCVPPSSFLEAALAAQGRFRIGVSTASPFDGYGDIRLAPEAISALDAGIAALSALGHDLVETDIRYDNRYPEAFTTVWTAGVGAARIPAESEALLMPLTRAFRARARIRTGTDLADAVALLRQFEWDSIVQYAAYDMILTPALAMTPRPIGWYGDDPDTDYRRQCQYCPYSSMVNVIGVPALTVPTHRTAAGLPMGIQLIGRPSAEAELLSVAAQLEG